MSQHEQPSSWYLTPKRRQLSIPMLMLAAALVVAVVIALALGRSMLGTGAGLLAKQLCSLTYVSQLAPDRARALYLDPLLGPAASFIQHELTQDPPGVTTAGLTVSANAIYRQGYGCTLLHNGAKPFTFTPIETHNRFHEGVDVQVRNQHFDPTQLEAALAKAFAEPDTSTTTTHMTRQTLAIAVRFRGALVAEGYATGITPHTALPGWSLAKSATTTIAGYLTAQGLVTPQDSALFPQWGRDDHRASITLDHLLRMTSGLDINETGTGLDGNSTMLFKQADTGAWAVAQGLQHNPGSHWHYSGGNTTVAAYYLTQRLGGPEAMYQQVHQLFDVLGMHTAVLEPDAAGTFLGSSFMLASARDYSKLGQLYLQEGIWTRKKEGKESVLAKPAEERLLPNDWVSYVTRQTNASSSSNPARPYGAGFWVASKADVFSEQALPAPPASSYNAHGMQNQAIYILPEQELVIVRLGATQDYWQSGEWDLVADVIAARRES